MNVTLTDHAITRYAERVRPTLTRSAAERELRSLVDQGTLEAECSWHLGRDIDLDAYLILSDGIALGLLTGSAGIWRAVTTLTRSGASDDFRAKRNAWKASQRAAKRARKRQRRPRPPR